MFLSVIIPVYNVEPYLRRCIDSVVRQDMGDELELILVDDGSKDGSSAICDEYATKYPWIHVYHIPNGGVGNARNYGIEHAKGDYITFIDSDDFIDDGIYKEALRLHNEQKSDVYMFGYKDYPLSNGNVHRLPEQRADKPEALANLYTEIKSNYMMFSVINKIFNFVDNRVSRFSTNLHYFEDCLFVLDCLKNAKSVQVMDCAPYNYVHHPGEHLGTKYTAPDIMLRVAREMKAKSDVLPQSEAFSLYNILEYYNIHLNAIDVCLSLKDRVKYIKVFLSELKKFGHLEELKSFLGRRKILVMFPYTLGMLVMWYVRKLLLIIKK